MNSVYLVSCISRKRPGPAPAKDLYTSDWFRKASAYVAATGMPWFIWTRDHVKVRELERAVSEHIRAMPFLWIDIDDRTGADSLRGFVERNAIALLSNFEK